MFKLIHADCMDALDKMEDNSIGSCITDPPYLINFMGKKWDTENSPAGDDRFWEKVLTKLKPGAYCVAFGHSRQHHRVMVAMEDAGFEIRDCMMWLYAQGFPKSHNVGKAVDKLLGKKREVVGKGQHTNIHSFTNPDAYTGTDTKPDITKGNSEWEGYGTALKPAYEPIIIARKPIEKKLTVAKNVLKHGVGAINIDGCRVSAPGEDFSDVKPRQIQKLHSLNHDENSVTYKEAKEKLQNIGRFPANVMLSHHPDCVEVGTREDAYVINKLEEWSGFGEKECPDYQSTKMRTVTKVYECVDDCPTKILDEQAPKVGSLFKAKRKKDTSGGSGISWTNGGNKEGEDNGLYDGLGGASRFFKCVGGGEDLKPGYEPIIIARKPLEKKLTVAKNVLKHGVGAINIDGCRVGSEAITVNGVGNKWVENNPHGQRTGKSVKGANTTNIGRFPANVILSHSDGCVKVGETEDTFAANDKDKGFFEKPSSMLFMDKNYKHKKATTVREVYECVDGCPTKILDGQSGTTKSSKRGSKYNKKTENREGYTPVQSDYREDNTYGDKGGASRFFKCVDDCAVKILDKQAPKTGQIHGTTGKEPSASKPNAIYNDYSMVEGKASTPKDKLGGASRFFYHAKVGKKERNLGCNGLETKTSQLNAGGLGRKTSVEKRKENTGTNAPVAKNIHPTVKPIALMRYLIKMYCPPNETVLDPFTGSGSTGMAAMYEGRDFIGIEREEEYLEIAEARIEYAEEDMSRRTKP